MYTVHRPQREHFRLRVRLLLSCDQQYRDGGKSDIFIHLIQKSLIFSGKIMDVI